VSTADPQQDAGTPDAIPAKTTPTWEMELLLSGATVFGLMQAPAYLYEAAEPLFARLGSDYAFLARMLMMYLGAALYALLATFILHLLVRAAWIAAVGVRSMYPDGPDVSKLRGGPIGRRVALELPSLTQVIDRLDNLATTIFALGAITVMGALITAAIAVPAFALDFIAESRFGQHDFNWSLWVIGLMFGPLVIAIVIDKLFGAKLAATNRVARIVAATYRVYRSTVSPSVTTVLMNTLMTRLGTVRVLAIYLTALTGLMFVVVLQMKSRSTGSAIGDYAQLPVARSGLVVQPFHYLDQRNAGQAARLDPYIESLRPQDAWMRVYLPFDAGRHGKAIDTDCPALALVPPATAADDTEDATFIDADLSARLECLARLHHLQIDGVTPKQVDYSVYIDPDTGVRGVMAMVDIAELARGRHVVELHWQPTLREVEWKRMRSDYRIPFWK